MEACVKNSREVRPAKDELLRKDGTLNPTPEKVLDAKFLEDGFFDPHDLVQVRYEMLRRVSVENVSITHVVQEYGISRPTYYQAKTSLEAQGLAGLVPKKRGPHGPHKLSAQIISFLKRQILPGQPIRARELVRLVRERFGLQVHPRTIERVLAEKKTPE